MSDTDNIINKTLVGQSILQGLREVLAYEQGKETKAKVHVIELYHS